MSNTISIDDWNFIIRIWTTLTCSSWTMHQQLSMASEASIVFSLAAEISVSEKLYVNENNLSKIH